MEAKRDREYSAALTGQAVCFYDTISILDQGFFLFLLLFCVVCKEKYHEPSSLKQIQKQECFEFYVYFNKCFQTRFSQLPLSYKSSKKLHFQFIFRYVNTSDLIMIHLNQRREIFHETYLIYTK